MRDAAGVHLLKCEIPESDRRCVKRREKKKHSHSSKRPRHRARDDCSSSSFLEKEKKKSWPIFEIFYTERSLMSVSRLFQRLFCHMRGVYSIKSAIQRTPATRSNILGALTIESKIERTLRFTRVIATRRSANAVLPHSRTRPTSVTATARLEPNTRHSLRVPRTPLVSSPHDTRASHRPSTSVSANPLSTSRRSRQ